MEAHNAGLVRIYAGPDTAIIAGGTLCGQDHIAHLFAWAIERRETADTALQLPFYHPTFEEGLKPALRANLQSRKITRPRGTSRPPGA